MSKVHSAPKMIISSVCIADMLYITKNIKNIKKLIVSP